MGETGDDPKVLAAPGSRPSHESHTGPNRSGIESKALEVATRIGERLVRDAIWTDERCHWKGVTEVLVSGHYQRLPRDLGPDVYAGSAGTALFLVRLSVASQSGELGVVARAGIEDALARAPRVAEASLTSFWSGLVGIAFVAVEVGLALGDTRLVDQGLTLAGAAGLTDPARQNVDALLGLAGGIPALVSLDARYPDRGLLDPAVRFGRHLLAIARRGSAGMSWKADGPLADLNHGDLTGYAHGAAGIAHALLELYAATGETAFLTAVEEAFEYEDSFFDPSRGNWRDLRYMAGPDGDTNDGDVYHLQWCFGAPGIGLTRLRAFEVTGNDAHRDAIASATAAVSADLTRYPHCLQPNFSLCHGVCGNADFLLQCGGLTSSAERDAILKIARAGIHLYHAGAAPWPGIYGSSEVPGLMTGLAGTGYFYLRLADASAHPSPLLLRARSSTE